MEGSLEELGDQERGLEGPLWGTPAPSTPCSLLGRPRPSGFCGQGYSQGSSQPTMAGSLALLPRVSGAAVLLLLLQCLVGCRAGILCQAQRRSSLTSDTLQSHPPGSLTALSPIDGRGARFWGRPVGGCCSGWIPLALQRSSWACLKVAPAGICAA